MTPIAQPISVATPEFDRRRVLGALAAGTLVCVAAMLPNRAHAASVEEAVAELQHDWEVIKYQTAQAQREARFEALSDKAHTVSASFPGRAEPLIWEGIIVASWAGEKGGLGALSLVKKAKALYESAIQIDGSVLDGSAYASLGVLYYRVPGWPIGFGDKSKARELIQKALTLNPKGIDPNFFYGELLVETKHADEAVTYLERALQAPPRPSRQIADTGRREEIRVLLEKIKSR
jgi:tetratricopeptide (TPR) repeat protein